MAPLILIEALKQHVFRSGLEQSVIAKLRGKALREAGLANANGSFYGDVAGELLQVHAVWDGPVSLSLFQRPKDTLLARREVRAGRTSEFDLHEALECAPFL